MSYMDEIVRRRRAKERGRRIAQDIGYRQGMREMENGQKKLKSLTEEYAAKAVEAEKSGNHAQAVGLALQAKRLKQYQTSSGAVKATLESARAVSVTNRAMMDILGGAGALAESAARMADPVALSEAQAGMLAAQEGMEVLMEGSEAAFGWMEEDRKNASEEDEACLAQLMESERRRRRSRAIEDTEKQLNRLQRQRAAEK